MAKSRFEYVKTYEKDDRLLAECWIVVRLDGKAFHRFSENHSFTKPNDERALNLMNKAAETVMNKFKDIILAYGQSDEYSFVLRPETDLHNRRESKLLSTLVSLFSSSYCFYWKDYFPDQELQELAIFDGRVVLYPKDKIMRDYLSWRQADCHINNQYNTVFWALVLKGGLTPTEAEKRLQGTNSAEKNEIMFSQFGINYNNEPEMFKKGTILIAIDEDSVNESSRKKKQRKNITIKKLHTDIIKNDFWEQHAFLLKITET